MNKSEPVIKVGSFSGNNGPEFYRKPQESTYEKPAVDYKYSIPSPSVAEAKKMLQQRMQEEHLL